MLTQLRVPKSLDCADLGLEREPVTGRVLFVPAPLAALCRFNTLEPEQILADEDLSCRLICEWYVAHIEAGGEPDPVAEAKLAEVAELEATNIAALEPGSGIPSKHRQMEFARFHLRRSAQLS